MVYGAGLRGRRTSADLLRLLDLRFAIEHHAEQAELV